MEHKFLTSRLTVIARADERTYIHAQTDPKPFFCFAGLLRKSRSHKKRTKPEIISLVLSARAGFFWLTFMFRVYVCAVSVFLVVTTSAIDCLERLISDMFYYVSTGTLNSSLTTLCRGYM